jgi:hypothetical protein
MDPDVLAEIKLALEDSGRVDASRIVLEGTGDSVVLRGAVASSEEATAAAMIAETRTSNVANELTIDPGLREGAIDPVSVERVQPAEDEVLVGSTDMLAGPDAAITSDLNRALEENEPWNPPDEPRLAPTHDEYGGAASPGALSGDEERGDPDPDLAHREDYAAADLSREDLQAEGATPSLDPRGVQPSSLAQPDPLGREEGGGSPPDEPEPFPPRVPGTEAGLGATGEGTVGGGGISGAAATETGARGADTQAADPARSTGGTMSDAGTERGPQSREDEALREDFPDAGA